jgi:hypothetical protein
LASLNIEINSPPVIDELTCSTTTATRGGVVICRAEISDDFGIDHATLFWRYNGSNESSYIPITASSQSGSAIWTAAIPLPVDAPLDSVDLYWSVFDIQGLSAEGYWNAAFNITDASATWYGVHVEGADLAPWLGIDPPVHGNSGWIRGRTHKMTACVIDLDHDNVSEKPTIIVAGSQLETPTQSSSSGSQTCYQSSWAPIAGGSLEPVSVTLHVGGNELSNRSLSPIDLAPNAELIIDGQSYLDGAQDRLQILIIDEDDPDASYSVETQIDWPGAGSQMLDGNIITAPPGLESGDAFISARITSGIWTDLEWSWTQPVFLTPPQISAPTLCSDGLLVDTINRGTDSTDLWVGISDARPIQFAGLRLGPDGPPSNVFSSVFFEQGVPPAPCVPGTGEHTQYYRIDLNSDYLLTWPLGTVELIVNLRDIDGITGLSQTLSFELRGSEPILDFSGMPTEFISGNSSTLLVEIIDLDGVEGMECSILLKDKDEITLFSEIFRPEADGVWTQEWAPPGRTEENHTLYFACLDETSLSVSESFLIRAREGTIVPEVEGNTTQQGVEGTSSTTVLIGVSTLFIVIIGMTALLIGRREEDHIEKEEILPDDIWAKRDEDGSDDVLTEMAGLEKNDSHDWSDAELLSAGWTQAQIDVYREEMQSQEIEIDEEE